MSAHLLLDPAILEPPGEDCPSDWPHFWLRVLAWAGDSRVKVGQESFSLAVEQFEIFADVEREDANFPPHTKRERRKAVQILMARVLDRRHEGPTGCLTPDRTASADATNALARDLASAAAIGGPCCVATERHLWVDGSERGHCDPPPPEDFEFCFEPNGELLAEVHTRVSDALMGARIFIVGGQAEPRVLDELEGMGAEVSWLPSERHKKPKLDAWRSLTNEDFAVCVTGRIGHSSSNEAAKMADKAGLRLIEARQVGDVIAAIEAAVQRRGCEASDN